MTIYNILAALLMVLVLGLGFRRFGWNSILGFSLIGSAIYSLPLAIGVYKPFDLQDSFAEVSFPALIIGVLVWIVYLFSVITIPVNANKKNNPIKKRNYYLASCLVLAILGLFYIILNNGILFFLNARHDISFDEVAILWRWVLIFGIVISFVEKKGIYIFIFSLLIIIYYIAGDRTVLAITIAACFIYNYQIKKIRRFLPSLLNSLLLFFIFILLIFGKLFYLLVKDPTLESFLYLFSSDVIFATFLSFEPLGTHSHLENVIKNELTSDPYKFFISLFGNFLLVPSYFNVSTNYFNEEMSAHAFQGVNYGVAGHFYASIYFGLGIVGVAIVPFLYLAGLNFIEKISFRANGFLKVALVVAGATLAIYIHRNGIDNIFSFMRQIFIVSVLIVSLSMLISTLNSIYYKSH